MTFSHYYNGIIIIIERMINNHQIYLEIHHNTEDQTFMNLKTNNDQELLNYLEIHKCLASYIMVNLKTNPIIVNHTFCYYSYSNERVSGSLIIFSYLRKYYYYFAVASKALLCLGILLMKKRVRDRSLCHTFHEKRNYQKLWRNWKQGKKIARITIFYGFGCLWIFSF